MAFIDDLKNSLRELATLKITTIVGTATQDANGNWQPDAGAKVMRSTIDLVQGDQLSVIHEDLNKPEYDSIRQAHIAREDDGRKIIQDNINCLKELVSLARDLGGDGA